MSYKHILPIYTPCCCTAAAMTYILIILRCKSSDGDLHQHIYIIAVQTLKPIRNNIFKMFRKILSQNLPRNMRKCKFVVNFSHCFFWSVQWFLDSGYQLPQNIEEILQSQTREVASSQAARYKQQTMNSYFYLPSKGVKKRKQRCNVDCKVTSMHSKH